MEFKDCRAGYSFFKKIDSVWGDLNGKYTLNRIFTIMRFMNAETLITETLNEKCSEWGRFRQEEAAMRLRLGGQLTGKIHAIKFTFLRKRAENEKALAELAQATAKGEEDVFLGYAIVVNIPVKLGVWSFVFESVVRELGIWNGAGQWQPLPYHYLHVKKDFYGQVGNVDYKIRGTYFRQQNSITNVCAHSCVTMMLNNASLPHAIVTAEDINAFLGYDHDKRKFRINENCIGEKEDFPAGPGIPQLKGVFKNYGYEPHLLEFDDENKQRKFRSFLYGFVESQFPALLTFGSHEGSTDEVGHVVPVVGHTMNFNSWLPVTGSYTVGNWSDKHHSPLGWIDDLVIHDDNHGMQFSLPAHAFKPATNPDKDNNLTPREALGIFPVSYGIQMLGNVAESVAASTIRTMAEKSQGEIFKGNYYAERFWSERKKTLRQTTIFRPVLVKWNEYLKSFWGEKKMPADTARFVERIDGQGITHVWLVEITEPDLFVGNHAKVMDVLLNPRLKPAIENEGRADESMVLPEGTVLMVRLPQYAIAPKVGTNQWERISGWGVEGHMPLFCHEHA